MDSAADAWARLAGLPALAGLQVVVDPSSPLGPRGWIAVLAIGSSITASVPRPELEAPVLAGLTGLTADEATTPGIVMPRLPPARATLGPAHLFYPPAGWAPPSPVGVEPASGEELAPLLAAADAADLEESGIAHVESPVFASRAPDGAVASACGYRVWTNGVAHLSVLTHPDHRRRGHGRSAAAATVAHAVDHGLLPQWRARPMASQRLAVALGLVRVGAQFSVLPD